MRSLSRRTLAELLGAQLRGLGAFSLYARKLGPHDVCYLSAQAFRDDGEVVEAKASAMEFSQAFVQLLDNLEHARVVEERPEPRVLSPQRAVRIPPSASKPQRPASATYAERARRIAMKLVERWGSVTAQRLSEAAASKPEDARALLLELEAAGELVRSKRFGWVAPGSPDADPPEVAP